jgi:hypothetical protein
VGHRPFKSPLVSSDAQDEGELRKREIKQAEKLSTFGRDPLIEPKTPINQAKSDSEKIISATKKRTMSEMMADNLPKPLNLNPLGTPKKPLLQRS